MQNKKTFAAILLMAGQSQRFNHLKKKPFHLLKNKPVYQWSLDTFLTHPKIKKVYLVVDKEERHQVDPKGAVFVNGGKTRMESSYLGVKTAKEDYVLIHDCARPFITKKIIDDNIAKVVQFGAVDTAIKSVDSLLMSDGVKMEKSVDQSRMYQGQTPQSFSRKLVMNAQKEALNSGVESSCDCQAVCLSGHQVYIAQGSPLNFKLTYFQDLQLANQMISDWHPLLPKESVVSENEVKSIEDFRAFVSLPMKQLTITKLKISNLTLTSKRGRVEKFMEDNKKVKWILERITTAQEALIPTTTKDVKENIKTEQEQEISKK